MKLATIRTATARAVRRRRRRGRDRSSLRRRAAQGIRLAASPSRRQVRPRRRLARLRHARHVAGEDDLRRAQLPRSHRRDRAHAARVPDAVHEVRPLADRRLRPDPDARRRVGRGRLGGRARRGDRHRGRRGSEEEAAAAIAGYTVVNDISVRDWQYRSTQFLQGKAWEGSTPVGPYLVTTEPGARRRSRSVASSTAR